MLKADILVKRISYMQGRLMMYKYRNTFLILLMVLCTSCSMKGPEQKTQVEVNEILKTSRSWDGAKIEYPKGDPEVTAIIIKMEEGYDTGYHCHPVPNLAYMLKGEIEVEVFNGPKNIFREGDAFEEVIHSWHRGKVLKGPVEVLVFYVGEKDIPITIRPKGDDLKNEKCIK